jgi:hypothetical protein
MPPVIDKPSHQPARVHVDRIGAEPMTSQQRQQATAALAALIAAWQHARRAARDERGSDSVSPLPLTGAASDTDHAA